LIARIYIEQHRLNDATKALDAAVAADTDAIYAKTLLEKIKSGGYDASPGPDATPRPLETK
jgi:hypothetical protein